MKLCAHAHDRVICSPLMGLGGIGAIAVPSTWLLCDDGVVSRCEVEVAS